MHSVLSTTSNSVNSDLVITISKVGSDWLADIKSKFRLVIQHCALQASDSGLLSADSEHLFMCQEIWKR